MFDTVNERGVEQLLYVFTELQKKAASVLPTRFADLGELIAIDGSLIDSVLSMHWAGYRKNTNKAKLHLRFNLNHSVPRKLFLTEGNGAERLLFSWIIYKHRWDIEKFFAWWKRHLKVYHLFARSKNGLMVQIFSGLITYLLLAIYCHEQHRETFSVQRVRPAV